MAPVNDAPRSPCSPRPTSGPASAPEPAPDGAPRRRGPWWARWLLMLLTLALTLGAAELMIRWIHGKRFTYYTSFKSRPLIFHGPYGKRLGAEFEDVLYNYRMFEPDAPLRPWRVRTSAKGWREPEYTRYKPPGLRRWMILGDSVAYGQGVEAEALVAAWLRMALQLDGEGATWEVLNRAVPGWQTWNQAAYLRVNGAKWKPDVVTVLVCLNDFLPFTDAEVEANIPPPPAAYLLRRSHLANCLRILASDDRPPPSGPLPMATRVIPRERWGAGYKEDKWWFIRGRYDTPAGEALYERTKALTLPRFLDLKRQCEAIDARLIVAILPTASQVSKRYWGWYEMEDPVLEARPNREITAWLRARGVDTIDLLDHFRASDAEPLFIDEVHLSEAGHQLVATALLRHALRAGVVNLRALPLRLGGEQDTPPNVAPTAAPPAPPAP